jgi:hypothetical protein
VISNNAVEGISFQQYPERNKHHLWDSVPLMACIMNLEMPSDALVNLRTTNSKIRAIREPTWD